MFKSEPRLPSLESSLSLLPSVPLQVSASADTLLYIVFFMGLFVFQFAFGTRIQVYFALNDIGRGLTKLKVMKEKSRKEAIDYLVNVGKAPSDPSQRVDQFLD